MNYFLMYLRLILEFLESISISVYSYASIIFLNYFIVIVCFNICLYFSSLYMQYFQICMRTLRFNNVLIFATNLFYKNVFVLVSLDWSFTVFHPVTDVCVWGEEVYICLKLEVI